ncbi:MAG: NYN domain-containing protein [Gemmatimonadota bacterium]|nr:NYN domain-containing protein [Gemmatimonadota bacterium]
MSFPNRYAILVDGEWFKKDLHGKTTKSPNARDIFDQIEKIRTHCKLNGTDLYRIFYYTADPFEGTVQNPVNKESTKFSATSQFLNNTRLIKEIESCSDYAVRRGRLIHRGWTLRRKALARLEDDSQHTVGASDIEPNITQKGVDMMIGIDMTSLALKRLVSTVVIASGDSDLVPAMKLARTEGLRVYLAIFQKSRISRDLRIHNDDILTL